MGSSAPPPVLFLSAAGSQGGGLGASSPHHPLLAESVLGGMARQWGHGLAHSPLEAEGGVLRARQASGALSSQPYRPGFKYLWDYLGWPQGSQVAVRPPASLAAKPPSFSFLTGKCQTLPIFFRDSSPSSLPTHRGLGKPELSKLIPSPHSARWVTLKLPSESIQHPDSHFPRLRPWLFLFLFSCRKQI